MTSYLNAEDFKDADQEMQLKYRGSFTFYANNGLFRISLVSFENGFACILRAYYIYKWNFPLDLWELQSQFSEEYQIN